MNQLQNNELTKERVRHRFRCESSTISSTSEADALSIDPRVLAIHQIVAAHHFITDQLQMGQNS